MGLPCAHIIENRKELGQGLLPDDFHLHWYWERYSEDLQPLILEPLQIISKGAPRIGSKLGKRSTKRVPSGFEAIEGRKARRCGLCKLPGHDRRNGSCMVRLRQDGEELGLDTGASTPRTVFNPDTTITTISYTDKDSTVAQGPALLDSIDPRIQIEEESDPEVPDTRPIWPRRPEVIYSKYLAKKEAYLIAHPDVRESNYRSVRGLQIRSVKERKYWIRFMGWQRLDLETETLLDGRPHWTQEELDAYADFQALENKREEQAVEAERAVQGGFGQSTKRGVKTVHARINFQIQQENSQYRFAP